MALSAETGKVHPTAAGLLMFGYEYEIVREFPLYFLDYQEKYDDAIRWTDRVEWQLKQLRDKNIIQHVGPKKGGHWEIIK